MREIEAGKPHHSITREELDKAEQAFEGKIAYVSRRDIVETFLSEPEINGVRDLIEKAKRRVVGG